MEINEYIIGELCQPLVSSSFLFPSKTHLKYSYTMYHTPQQVGHYTLRTDVSAPVNPLILLFSEPS